MRVIFTVARGCTHCGTCIYECPVGAIRLTPGGAIIEPTKCTGCGRCMANCASEAIKKTVIEEINGKEQTHDTIQTK